MRRTGMKIVIASSLIILAQACVSTGSGDAIRRDPDLIEADELANYSTMMLGDAIRQLRPRWMNVRGSAMGSAVPVIMDGGVPQDWMVLEAIRPNQVRSVRYHNPGDATMRWGTGFPNGLIEVSTLRGRGGG